MANGSHPPHAALRARHGEPQPAPPTIQEPAPTKRDLASWWRQFSKRGAVKKEEDKGTGPLLRSVCSPRVHGVCVALAGLGRALLPSFLPRLFSMLTQCARRRARTALYLWRRPHHQHPLRQRGHLALQRHGRKLHLRIRAHCRGQVWRLPQGEGSVLPWPAPRLLPRRLTLPSHRRRGHLPPRRVGEAHQGTQSAVRHASAVGQGPRLVWLHGA